MINLQAVFITFMFSIPDLLLPLEHSLDADLSQMSATEDTLMLTVIERVIICPYKRDKCRSLHLLGNNCK